MATADVGSILSTLIPINVIFGESSWHRRLSTSRQRSVNVFFEHAIDSTLASHLLSCHAERPWMTDLLTGMPWHAPTAAISTLPTRHSGIATESSCEATRVVKCDSKATASPPSQALQVCWSSPSTASSSTASRRGTLSQPCCGTRQVFCPNHAAKLAYICLLYTSPSPRDGLLSRMPSSA